MQFLPSFLPSLHIALGMVSVYLVNSKVVPRYGHNMMVLESVLVLYCTVPGATSSSYRQLQHYGHISMKLHKVVLELVIGVDVEEMSLCDQIQWKLISIQQGN